MAKLIRDKVATEILAITPNRIALFQGLEDKQKALNNKIIEESLELAEELEKKDVDENAIIEEAADIIECIYAICDFKNIDIEEVYEMLLAKRKIKGRFLTFSCLLDDDVDMIDFL